MGIERYFWFVNPGAIEPVLDMSWRAFLREYPLRGGRSSFFNGGRHPAEDFVEFVVEPEPDAESIRDILARRTLRWTMQRASPQYWFLDQIVHHVPSLKERCREVWVAKDKRREPAVVDAVAINAFLDDRIDGRTYLAVHNIIGRYDPRRWLRLNRIQLRKLEKNRLSWTGETPVFRWQNAKSLDEGSRCLRQRDTRRFIGFLEQAWLENWSAPNLRCDIRAELNVPNRITPRFRDFELTSNLVKYVSEIRDEATCVLYYDESLVM
jgi:hypothetical protein